MHICLPDTREVRPQSGSAYLLYNVHIDGLYHCSLRYKQLLHLHRSLLKKFAGPYHQLPAFPPKKLLPMSANQLEERRIQLEKYLQNISQDKAISNSSIFNLFLLEAQRESTRIRQDQAHLDIELVNGQKIRLQVFTHDSADAVLTSVCRALGLNDRYHAYFCLCLCGYDVIRDKLIIKRRLSFFESPYVTLQMAIQQQEQLHNLLTASSSDQCHCYAATTTNSQSQQQQLTAAAATAAAIAVTNNNCQCLSCLSLNQHHHHHQQSSNLITATSNDVPLVGSSSGSISTSTAATNANHLSHYNNINHQGNNNSNSNNNYQHQQQYQTLYYAYQNYHTINPNHIVDPSSSAVEAAAPATVSTSSFVTHRILLRKSYWDPVYDTYILNDQQALNLLFIQTVYDIKHSLMFVNRETYHKLESLLASDSKLEYILLARTLKYYNYVNFEPCLSDYPRPRTKVMISIGSKELNMRVLKSPRSLTKSASTARQNSNNNGSQVDVNPLLAPSSSSSASISTSASSSPSSTASASTSASSSITASSSNTNQSVAVAKTNQQVKEPSDQILYCTSSMVPSGYLHLITKEDLIEEEYSFKVPLIRCWRLTSIETLNSNPAANSNNKCNQFPQGAASNARTKTLSLFNNLSISSSGSSSNNYNNEVHANNGRRNDQRRENLHTNGHRNGNDNNASHGFGGSSLLAALVGSVNGFHRLGLPQNNSDCQSNSNCQPDNHRCPMEQEVASSQPFSQYELSFEYLVSKDTLRWITISSDQAIFISISLQGVVDELVSKRDGETSLYQNSAQIDPATLLTSNETSSQQCFTYLYRDGRQKALNTSNQQLIDRFGTTLGYSPMNQGALALSRQRQQSLRASNSSSFLSASSRFSFLSSSPTTDMNGNHHHQQQHSALEISHLKKAPSPIINDAFEGVTNDDDL